MEETNFNHAVFASNLQELLSECLPLRSVGIGKEVGNGTRWCQNLLLLVLIVKRIVEFKWCFCQFELLMYLTYVSLCFMDVKCNASAIGGHIKMIHAAGSSV